MIERTLQDFVEDMHTDGATVDEIRIVAFATRWRSYISEIVKYAKELSKATKFKRRELKPTEVKSMFSLWGHKTRI